MYAYVWAPMGGVCLAPVGGGSGLGARMGESDGLGARRQLGGFERPQGGGGAWASSNSFVTES